MAKQAKKNDDITTGILVTRFNMGLINVKDLEQMAKDCCGPFQECSPWSGSDLVYSRYLRHQFLSKSASNTIRCLMPELPHPLRTEQFFGEIAS